IAELHRASPGMIGVILAGHGITAWGATSEECEANSLQIITGAQRYLDEHGARQSFGNEVPGYGPLPAAARRARAVELAPLLRGLASPARPQGGPYPDDAAVLGFPARGKPPALAALGPSCPDHFLRTKVAPPGLDPAAAAPLAGVAGRLRELHAAYRE